MTFQQNLICFSWKILKRQTSNVVSSKIYSILASPSMFFKYLFFNHIFIYIYGKTFNSVASVWQLVARLRGGCSLVENSPNFFIAIFDVFMQLCVAFKHDSTRSELVQIMMLDGDARLGVPFLANLSSKFKRITKKSRGEEREFNCDFSLRWHVGTSVWVTLRSNDL